MVQQTNPCVPSPCGANAECRVVGDTPSCSCLAGFLGLPPNCRPECVSNSECPSHLACMTQKCRDPCVGSCATNAECRVVSHTPMCVCPNDFTGDPFTQCIMKQRKHQLHMRKISSRSFMTVTLTVSPTSSNSFLFFIFLFLFFGKDNLSTMT